MNRFDQRKITKNLVALRKAIQNDVNFIADKLYDQAVFSKEERNEIADVRPRLAHLQCGVLINKLLRGGKDAYDKFRAILEEMGHKDIVTVMERSAHKGPSNTWIDRSEEREKTFIVPNPKLPERLTTEPMKDDEEDVRNTESRIDEVHQLERMMTFVLASLDGKDKNNNTSTSDFKNELRQKLKEESNGNEELLGFFNSLRYNSFSLTSQSIAH